jgi:hypothetical protein
MPKIPGNLPNLVPHTKTVEKVYINVPEKKIDVSS